MEEIIHKQSLTDILLKNTIKTFCGLLDILGTTNFYPLRKDITNYLDQNIPSFDPQYSEDESVAKVNYAFGAICATQIELFGLSSIIIFAGNGEYKKALIYPMAKVITNGLSYFILKK